MKKSISGKIASPLLWSRHELSSRFRVFLTTHSTTPFIHGDDTGRRGVFLLQHRRSDATVSPPSLFHFYVYDEQQSR